jgi:uncharacterized protein (UPF0332 family)
MQWNEFLDTADRLSRGTTEGDWRSAISRSYYSLFHYFREFFLSNGLDIGRGAGQAHFNFYTGLSNCGFPSVSTLADRIDAVRRRRGEADYELRIVVTQVDATESVRNANDIIRTFQTLLTTIPAHQIVDGARCHLKAIGRIA